MRWVIYGEGGVFPRKAWKRQGKPVGQGKQVSQAGVSAGVQPHPGPAGSSGFEGGLRALCPLIE